MWSVPGHSPYGGAGGTTPPSVTPFTSAILDDTYILAKYEGHTITAAQVVKGKKLGDAYSLEVPFDEVTQAENCTAFRKTFTLLCDNPHYGVQDNKLCVMMPAKPAI